MSFQFIMPKQIFYGENALSTAAEHICALGKKALVVTDPMMVKLGNTAKITDILDKGDTRYAIFDGVISEPTDRIIEAGLKAWNNEKCDFLIAVGGGSPIDAMKAIGAVATSGSERYEGYFS